MASMTGVEDILQRGVEQVGKKVVKWLVGLLLPKILLILLVVSLIGAVLLWIQSNLLTDKTREQVSPLVKMHYEQYAEAWKHAPMHRTIIKWGGGGTIIRDDELTSEEIKEAEGVGLTLHWGLLAAVDKLYNNFNPETGKEDEPYIRPLIDEWELFTWKTKDGDTITREVPIHASVYNGTWTLHWTLKPLKNGGMELVLTGIDKKLDYARIKRLLQYRHMYNDLDLDSVLVIAHQIDDQFFDERLPNLISSFGLNDIPGAMDPGFIAPDDGQRLSQAELAQLIDEALKITNTPANWAPGLEIMVEHESHRNPHVTNPIGVDYYGNGQAIYHAKGLCQVMDPTFQAYKVPGHNDIYNPLDNLLASINYIKSKYGTVYNIPGITGGTYIGY